jgi:hypothetical protein
MINPLIRPFMVIVGMFILKNLYFVACKEQSGLRGYTSRFPYSASLYTGYSPITTLGHDRQSFPQLLAGTQRLSPHSSRLANFPLA